MPRHGCSLLTARAQRRLHLRVSANGPHQRQRRNRSWHSRDSPNRPRRHRQTRRHGGKRRLCHRCGVQRRRHRPQCDRIRAGHLRRGSVSRSIGRRARGVRVNEIGRAVECEVRRRGFSVIKGLSGHGVGRTIHEEPSVPNYYDPFQADVLTEGLGPHDRADDQRRIEHVVQDDDGWTLRTQDGSLSAHHEHTWSSRVERPSS